MPQPERWTQSMIEGWQYALYGADAGLGQTDALTQYRAGGGHISNEYWRDIYQMARESRDIGDRVVGQIADTPIPSQAYLPTPYKFQDEYVTIADIEYTDRDTGERKKGHVYVGSDILSPWAETQAIVEDIAAGDSPPGAAEGVVITGARLWHSALYEE